MQKVIKYKDKSYTFNRDSDGYIHPSGEDYESAEYLIDYKDVIVKHIAKIKKWKLPHEGKSICKYCGSPITDKKRYNERIK
tara:strand:- start:8 stop:250 length:243 start_codon:yes stop_codon:yes gene_type:complete